MKATEIPLPPRPRNIPFLFIAALAGLVGVLGEIPLWLGATAYVAGCLFYAVVWQVGWAAGWNARQDELIEAFEPLLKDRDQ